MSDATQKSAPEELDNAPGTRHRKPGRLECLARQRAETREALEKAFDYRGDLTLTLKNGEKIEGYIFDRKNDGATLAECNLRLIPKGRRRKNPRPLQRHRCPGLHRQRHCRRKELRSLGEEIPREEGGRAKPILASKPESLDE